MRWTKSLWARLTRRLRDEYDSTQDELSCRHHWLRVSASGLIIYMLMAGCLTLYWSIAPAPVNANAAIQLALKANLGKSESPKPEHLPKGVATTSVLISIADNLLHKHGGFLANDLLLPSAWTDDMPNWERGALTQVRDTTHVLVSVFSISSPVSPIDIDLQKAETRFNFSPDSFVFPASESQYQSGIEYLQQYNARLLSVGESSAYFYADVAHLNEYLLGVEQRLHTLSQRLTASVGPSVNSDASALSATQIPTNQSINGLYLKTSWWQLDDVFFEARGNAWAMIAILQAIEIDFNDVIVARGAKEKFAQAVRELIPTQQALYSPVILNGEGFGFVANHSLVMASYLARAQAAVADCRQQLLISH